VPGEERLASGILGAVDDDRTAEVVVRLGIERHTVAITVASVRADRRSR